MTWSYNSGDLATSPKDVVRLLIGDTDTTDPQLQDEEIDYLLTINAGPYIAGAQACETIAAKYARQVTRSFGGRSDQLTQLVTQYKQMAKMLRQQGTMKRISPWSGALTIQQHQDATQNADNVQPFFTRLTGSNPETQSQDNYGDQYLPPDEG